MTTLNHVAPPKLDFAKRFGFKNLTLVPAARDVIRQNAELAFVERWVGGVTV